MVKEIKRDYYLEQLIKREGNGLIKIVTGIRRCGKSYLLRTLFKNHLLENARLYLDGTVQMWVDAEDSFYL